MAKTKKPAKKPRPAAKPAKATGAARTKKPAAKNKAGTRPKKPARPKVAPAPPTNGGPARLFALLIACDCYLPNQLPEGYYPNLAGCVRDVNHVEEFLRRRLGLSEDRLIKLTSTDGGTGEPVEPPARRPTYENMVNAFRRLTETASKGDQVYVHYSGHGGQSPTLLPKLKGQRATDESLVPIDIGNTSARYLRDIEIAKLLKAMVDKGLVVTAVFDCCHSGGAARAAVRSDINMAVRGVAFVDSTPRPADSLVGRPEELAAIWEAGGAAPARAGMRSLVSQAANLGYTLLAACRPQESAYEAAFEGTERNGALTYWFLQALQQLSPELTYRMVYDRLLARIHSQFELQTPLLQGEADRVVFGTCTLLPEFATVVMSVAPDGRSVRLGAGQANLVRAGAQFAIYPNGTRDFSRTERRTALVRVREIGAADATADVVQVFGQAKVAPGDEAVLLGAPAQRLVRRVRVERADGHPPGPKDAALSAVLKALPGNGWVEAAAGPGDAADFVVRPDDRGTQILICDADGQPLTLRPEIGARDADAAGSVMHRLVHLAKYRAVRDLDNNDGSSPLSGKLVAELLRAPDDYDPADKPDGKPFPAGEPATLRPGRWAFLRVENRSDQAVNVTVLDLASDWSIAQAYPKDTDVAFAVLEAGKEPLVIPLRASLPDGYTSGTETLKVLATLEPTNFRVLQLPPLDQPAPARAAMRTRGGGPQGPLDELLAAVAADAPPTRAMTAAAAPSRGWAVAQVEVRVAAAGGRVAARGELPLGEAGVRTRQPQPTAEAPSRFRR